jgi:DNA-binding response OmpR family regulator
MSDRKRARGPAPPEATPRRVLVVDDNHDAAESLALLLRTSGHQVCLSHRGREALSTARSFQPDVVLLDIGLPDIDGLEVCRRLREAPELAGMRIVAVTGYDAAGDRQSIREAGFDAHFVKPLDFRALAAVLEPH